MKPTPYDMFIAAGYFDRLDQALARPDCKRARTVHRSLWAEESLRFEQTYNPLNIRISNKKGTIRSWLLTAFLLVIAGFGIFGIASFVMDASGQPFDPIPTSAESLQTTVEPNFEFYSVED